MVGKRRELIIFILIMFFQILTIVYWANEKCNYHVDELYSLGYASILTGKGDGAQYITMSPEFTFNEWISNDRLKRQLVVNEEEKITNAPLIDVIKKTVVGSNYVPLLNMAETFWGGEQVSVKPGLIINLVFFVIACVELVSLMTKLGVDKRVRYIMVAMFGFSGYMISAAVYIRFYMLVIMYMLIMLNLFYRLWSCNSWRLSIVLVSGIAIMAYLSYRDSEFMLPFFCAFMSAFVVALICRKKWKQLIVCAVTGVLGFVFIITTSDFVGILITPGRYDASNGVYVSASNTIRSASLSSVMEYMLWLKELFETKYFAAKSMVYIMVAVVTIVIIVVSGANGNTIHKFEMSRIHPLIPVAFLAWIGIYGVSSLLGQGRLICLLVIYTISFIGVAQALDFKMKIRISRFSPDTMFIMVLAAELVVYTLFVALCQYSIWRYYCYGFVSATIIFWYLIDRLLKRLRTDQLRNALIVALTFCVFANSLMFFGTRNIENIYEDEKVFITDVQANQNIDVVLISDVENGVISRHEAYDCVNMMPDNARLYFVNLGEYSFDIVDYPDQFLLWSYIERDLSGVLSDLRRHGYNVEDLGNDHCSKVYMCRM